jgi:hypothetical protein
MNGNETYETIMARAARLGISTPQEVVNYALRLLAQLVDETESGGQLLIQRDREVQELVFRDPARADHGPLGKVDVSAGERPTWRLARR